MVESIKEKANEFNDQTVRSFTEISEVPQECNKCGETIDKRLRRLDCQDGLCSDCNKKSTKQNV